MRIGLASLDAAPRGLAGAMSSACSATSGDRVDASALPYGWRTHAPILGKLEDT